MFAIFKKEISSFFSSPIAYLVIGTFLLINGMFLWVFKNPLNIPDSGFAELQPFFELAPAVLLLLIPAITMRSLADERQSGTLEILLTKPLGVRTIVLGKFLAAWTLALLALLPTLVYVYSLSALSNQQTPIDMASIGGSYAGLLFLASAYTAIGLFASSLTKNQIVAFITGVLICFLAYYGLNIITNTIASGYWLETIGLQNHYNSISRGVLVLSDLIYFITFSLIFLEFTQYSLQQNKNR